MRLILASTAANLLLAAAQLPAQSRSVVDSVLALNRSGQWELAGQLAAKSLSAAASTDERCALMFSGVYASTRLARFNAAPRQLKAFDDQCASSATAKQYASALADLRKELDLPRMPVAGVDWSAVDAFWMAVDTLSRGLEPSAAQWRSLLLTPGYRIAMISHPDMKRLIDLTFLPARRAERDSTLKRASDDSVTIAHLLDVGAARAELLRFRTALEPMMNDSIARAVKNAARFLPAGATDGATPPLVTMTFFASDGYSQQPGIVLDLYHVRENGLTDFLSHEFHHSFASRFDQVRAVSGAYARLYGPLRSLRNEGIADMIDKPHPLTGTPGLAWYTNAYNAAYAATPAKLHVLDSLLVAAAADSSVANAAADKARALLPYNSHPNGAYMARTILETFGADSLIVGVYSPFRFLRVFRAAEAKRGGPPSFSPAAVALLDRMEARFGSR